jgi:hypothetical protein
LLSVSLAFGKSEGVAYRVDFGIPVWLVLQVDFNFLILDIGLQERNSAPLCPRTRFIAVKLDRFGRFNRHF